MEQKLRFITLGDGRIEKERCCMNYQCKYCGARAKAGNFVAGLCLQVAVSHNGYCGAYVESDQYTGFVNECRTCTSYDEEKDECKNPVKQIPLETDFGSFGSDNGNYT